RANETAPADHAKLRPTQPRPGGKDGSRSTTTSARAAGRRTTTSARTAAGTRGRLPGPLRRRVPGRALALEDLREVAARDPAVHHRLPPAGRSEHPRVYRLFRNPLHEEVAAGPI